MEGFFYPSTDDFSRLLIAVGIEGCVELHREHKLVKEAQATMREEIQGNLKSMQDAEENLKKQEP
jgi:hypothetical protein